MAEAAVSLSSVFSAAQKAADLYLEEISQRQKEIENDYEKIINEAKSQAESIISDAEAQRDAVIEEVKRASVFLKKYKKLMEKKDVSFETSNISE